MPKDEPPFLRFAGAVHRRHVVVQLLERTGMGLFAGSSMGLVLLPLLLWADQPVEATVAGAIVMGGGLGLLWGIARRPSWIETATRVDRQLGLNDLLATALAMGSHPDDPWAATVVAVANARCASLPPRSVLLKRLDIRAWSGIGLLAAAVFSLALFFGSSNDSSAATNRSSASNATAPTADRQSDRFDRPLVALAPAGLPAAPEHDDPEAGRGIGRSTAAEQDAGAKPPGAAAPDNSSRQQTNGAAKPGIGGGSSQTNKKPDAAPAPRSPDETHESGAEPGNAKAFTKPAGNTGFGSPDAGHVPGAVTAGGTSAERFRKAHITEPWKTDAWPSDVRRAREAIDTGQVPPAYQELVRRYFDR